MQWPHWVLAKVSVLKHTENVELSANEVVAEKIEG